MSWTDLPRRSLELTQLLMQPTCMNFIEPVHLHADTSGFSFRLCPPKQILHTSSFSLFGLISAGLLGKVVAHAEVDRPVLAKLWNSVLLSGRPLDPVVPHLQLHSSQLNYVAASQSVLLDRMSPNRTLLVPSSSLLLTTFHTLSLASSYTVVEEQAVSVHAAPTSDYRKDYRQWPPQPAGAL